MTVGAGTRFLAGSSRERVVRGRVRDRVHPRRRADGRGGALMGRPVGPRFTFVCERCATTFERTPAEVKGGRTRFCSRLCWRGEFWDRVDKRDDGCWLWLGPLTPKGYGRTYHKGRVQFVHRIAWSLSGRELADGLELDHLCRVRHCVNPDHLEPVTHRENTLRGDTVTARNAAKTHCVKGHRYTPDNTRMYRGSRYCRTCVNHYSRLSKQRQRATRGVANG